MKICLAGKVSLVGYTMASIFCSFLFFICSFLLIVLISATLSLLSFFPEKYFGIMTIATSLLLLYLYVLIGRHNRQVHEWTCGIRTTTMESIRADKIEASIITTLFITGIILLMLMSLGIIDANLGHSMYISFSEFYSGYITWF